jgi:GNAT superfamily N-acetyltransferase
MAMVLSVAIPLIIRPCTQQDLRDLEWGDAFRHDRPLIEYVYQQTLMHEMAMLVATVEHEHVGQLWIDLARKPRITILWGLRVKPRWREHGIGTRLIKTARRAARAGRWSAAAVGRQPAPRALHGHLGISSSAADRDRYDHRRAARFIRGHAPSTRCWHACDHCNHRNAPEPPLLAHGHGPCSGRRRGQRT